MANKLWVEKYRPKTINEYVFKDAKFRSQVENWIKEKMIPNVLLSGSAGVGKTSIAKVLMREIGIDDYDVLELNASRTNSVDDVRDKITNFVQMLPFNSPFRVVLLDEADFFSINGQAALRGVIEEYSSTSRFILTANLPNKIIPALHSRCQQIHFSSLDSVEFTTRCAEILLTEGIQFDLEVLDTFIKATYPDLRKCINLLQQNSINGVLASINNEEAGGEDYKVQMIELVKKKKFNEARKLVCNSARPEEIEGLYTWMYQNLELFGEDDDTQDSALLIIKQGLVDHTLCADTELNLAATFVRLSRLGKK